MLKMKSLGKVSLVIILSVIRTHIMILESDYKSHELNMNFIDLASVRFGLVRFVGSFIFDCLCLLVSCSVELCRRHRIHLLIGN